jgi:hypothetical protein
MHEGFRSGIDAICRNVTEAIIAAGGEAVCVDARSKVKHSVLAANRGNVGWGLSLKCNLLRSRHPRKTRRGKESRLLTRAYRKLLW